jgi:hypothetical protein
MLNIKKKLNKQEDIPNFPCKDEVCKIYLKKQPFGIYRRVVSLK